MEGLLGKDIVELRNLLARKEITSVELTKFYLERIKKHDGALQSYLKVTEDLAINMAEEADKKLAKGEGRSPHGHSSWYQGYPVHP